jgi:protein-S-isoprenylcysteine O-methyltransferase Ste14
MRPIVAHSLVFGILFWATIAMAQVVELWTRRRTNQQGNGSPEWSFFVVVFLVLACFVGAVVASLEHVAPLPGGVYWPAIVGIPVMWIGIALRSWSIISLGQFFQIMVTVQEDHRVIEDGPYRLVRHPVYLATIIYLTGFGLVASDWVSLGLMLVGSTALFMVRIFVEERTLVEALGSEYSLYMQRTARLVPGVY